MTYWIISQPGLPKKSINDLSNVEFKALDRRIKIEKIKRRIND